MSATTHRQETAMAAYPVITLRPDDGVVVARGAIEPGTPVADGVAAAERIPAGHKVATRPSGRRMPWKVAGDVTSRVGLASTPNA